ncbi:hypothetical protein HYV64_04125 [Candidatus Shapirobacteria bacterium]|nr:hypothetical protein [Candidatus Shapirobacteria bacterium]
MKHRVLTSFVIIFTFCLTLGILRPKKTASVPPSSVKNTLSSSQLSYFSRISAPITTGDSIIRVGGTGLPSNTTNNLFIGDTIGIGTTGAGVGNTGGLTLYTVQDIGNTQTIEINSGIGQSNAFINAAIVATRSAIHTISFTPQSNFTGGFWQFLIKASTSTGEIHNDGIPDQNGFDLGSTTPSSTANGVGTRLKITDVTCPNWGVGVTTAYSVGTTAVVNSNTYHVVSCYLGVGGTNQVGVGYSMAIGADLASGSQLINPSPNHIIANEGNADVYTFFIRHLDSTASVIDSDTAQGKIAMVEAVRVTATIDPTLTFIIDATGVGVGATPCGLSAFGTNASNTTATAVTYGSLVLASPNDLAQRLSCVTNANSGYVVTVYEDGPMQNIADGTTLPDTDCNGGGCTTTTPAAWSTYTASGWGYAIQNLNIGVTVTDYQTGYRPFGNGTANAKEIIKNTTTPSATERAYVCYRATASTTQKAGNYESKLVYTATATF